MRDYDVKRDDLLPVKFAGQTHGFTKPIDWNKHSCGQDCGDLPLQLIFHSDTDVRQRSHQSVWALTWRQRIKLLFTGKVWLCVRNLQPPLSLHTHRVYPEGNRK